MSFLGEPTTLLMIVGLGMAGLWTVRVGRHRAYRAETDRIQRATNKLEEHTRALDAFLSLPNAPEPLRKLILKVSEAIEDHAFAVFMAQPSVLSEEPTDNELISVLDKYYRDQSSGADLFIQALFSGIDAALLMWPDTADSGSKPAPTREFIQREVITTAHVVRDKKPEWHPGGMLPA